jgi:hypothetical protein
MPSQDEIVPQKVLLSGLVEIAIAYRGILELASISQGEQRRKAREIAAMMLDGVNQLILNKVESYWGVRNLFDRAQKDFPESVL